MRPLGSQEQQSLLEVLGFWHKVEFFIPFDLDSRLAEIEEGNIRWLFEQDAQRHKDSSPWTVSLPDEYELSGFYLYLGIFDKSAISDACRTIVTSDNNLDKYEETERTDLDGRTCFARLQVSENGNLEFDGNRESVSISTLPWALGQLELGNISALTYASFEEARGKLSSSLQNFRSARQSSFLHNSDIADLHQLLCDWALFKPGHTHPLAGIEIRVKKRRNRPTFDAKLPPPEETNDDDEDADGEQPSIGILNSFFIEDIERAIRAVTSGAVPDVLRHYLQPLDDSGRLNLDSPQGLQAIFNTLHPSRTNRGRWFANSDRAAALTQQFAINTVLEPAAPPLFSVNGPPGTGKTTLLQDVFADLIVRRARVLARLKKPGDAFEDRRMPIQFEGMAESVSIRALKPELTGFEMVVASSNNRAVENVSRELPRRGVALGSEWRDIVHYMQTVAHKIAAQTESGSLKKLPDADVPWGLISCVLGNAANRRAFKERFAFMKLADDAEPAWFGADRPQTIYEWIDSYAGLSFTEAIAAFQACGNAVEERCRVLSGFADLARDKLESSDRIEQAQRQLAESREAEERVRGEMEQLAARQASVERTLTYLREDQQLIERTSPGFWARLRGTPAALQYRNARRENAASQLSMRRELAELRMRRDSRLAPALHQAVRSAAQAEEALRAAQAARNSLREFSSILHPEKLADLQSELFQTRGLWHDDELARLRSSLFAAALALHEAWLADVGKKKGPGFRSNIFAITRLLSNKRPENAAAAVAIWQSLFMIVPIVSTTFASFGRQFRDLPAASLGWVFIDEAGQAVPQAAVGALWRAQHALVVGDPLQIQPVFTLPSNFIAAMAALSPATATGRYSPHRVSVQRLADEASRFGANLANNADEPLWIGSPLRVHRRCIDPMFSWSNEIAYRGTMVHGLPHKQLPDAPPVHSESIWIDIEGKAHRRQAVLQQTRFMVDLIERLYQRDSKLPGIYVISPFKAVKNDLLKELENLQWTPPLKKRVLREWLRERIGTVHTFQGKEEDTVFMVLGADRDHAGAVEWTSSTPNLLNVALTRAKRRFYVVGDRKLWGAKGSFYPSAAHLASIDAEAFLAIASRGIRDKAAATN